MQLDETTLGLGSGVVENQRRETIRARLPADGPGDKPVRPSEWATSGLVILTGAGVSVAEPACVPSWWGFNQAVLDGVRARYLDEIGRPARARTAITRLSLDRLDVTEFSQVVHDAFVGKAWFELLKALDGVEPNANHRTLGALVATGLVRAIITTNFDTLQERTLPVGVSVLNAMSDEPPTGEKPVLVKLHGTAGKSDTLVDLASQKIRGVRPAWREWLTDMFGSHAVLVLGLSGADLDFGSDYLGLLGAARRTPWLGWNVRAGANLNPKVVQLLATAGERGHEVRGDLPDVLQSLGIGLVRVPGRSCGAKHDREPLPDTVGQWLDNFHPYAAAIVIWRLLDIVGSHSAAAAVRQHMRVLTAEAALPSVTLAQSPGVFAVIAQLGAEEPDGDRALQLLQRAERILDRIVSALWGGREMDADASLEVNDLRARLALDRALALLKGNGDYEGAADEVRLAWTFVAKLNGTQYDRRMAGLLQCAAIITHDHMRDTPAVRQQLENALTHAARAGDMGVATSGRRFGLPGVALV